MNALFFKLAGVYPRVYKRVGNKIKKAKTKSGVTMQVIGCALFAIAWLPIHILACLIGGLLESVREHTGKPKSKAQMEFEDLCDEVAIMIKEIKEL